MASGLGAQTNAANDPTFLAAVQDAIVQTAINVYSEATTLLSNLQQGVAVTSVVVTPALSSGIGSGTVLAFATGDTCVTNGTTSSGSQTITVNSFTPTRTHLSGEAVSPPAPSNHIFRASYANKVLNNPTGYAVLFAYACASQGADKTSSDSTIINTVSSVWNALAGA
jgi:hypothetical protein